MTQSSPLNSNKNTQKQYSNKYPAPSAKAFVTATTQKMDADIESMMHAVKQSLRMQFILFGVISLGLVLVILRPTPIAYIEVGPDGRYTERAPLSAPLLSTDTVLDFVVKSVRRAHTYSFTDFRRDFSDAREAFTNRGWQAFNQALEESQNLEFIQRNRAIATAQVDEAPIILQEGIDQSGRYSWLVQFPMKVNYTTSSDKVHSDLVVTVKLVRVSELERPLGIAIDQFVSR